MEESHSRDGNINDTTLNTDIVVNNDLGDHVNLDLVFGCQTKPDLGSIAAQTNSGVISNKDIKMNDDNKELVKPTGDQFCRIRLDSLIRLKDSTKLLLNVIEDIQSKTHCIDQNTEMCKLPPIATTSVISDLTDTTALKQLEIEAKNIDELFLQGELDDCSIYKRLTRKCHCLNRKEFNDFIIHFNENTTYAANNLGEIIKNIRILKRFLYMGDGYSKNALIFLNEGLTKCLHCERIDMLLAISHADLCNVFDDDSFVTKLIIWPYKFENFGYSDQTIQNLAARVLYRIAAEEEGRRYLTFNNKISNDIKKVLKKTQYQICTDIVEFLNSILISLTPSSPKVVSAFYCRADEGTIQKVINELIYFRIYMTVQELFNNLQVLLKFSENSFSKFYMKPFMPSMLNSFKCLILEYDCSELNALIAKILLNNIQVQEIKTIKRNPEKVATLISDAATEAIITKHKFIQVPSLRDLKKLNKLLGRTTKKPLSRFRLSDEMNYSKQKSIQSYKRVSSRYLKSPSKNKK